MQRTNFDAENAADAELKSTSRIARESIAPVLSTIKQLVLDTIRKSPNGLNCDECEAITGLKHQTCSARFRDLKDMGLIVKTGERRNTRSGRPADVWINTERRRNATQDTTA